MQRRSAEQKRRVRRSMALVVVGAVLAVVAASRLSGWAQWRAFEGSVDAIVTEDGPAETTPVLLRFRYRGEPHMVAFEVPVSEVTRSAEVRTERVFRLPDAARERYFLHLIRATSHSRSVRALADELRLVRLRERLDDDEYLELMMRAVQEIPYGTVAHEFILPAEVLAGGAGVCSEKSLLLASLLAHEGFETALIILDAEGHVAVGVGSDGEGFLGSGYAFVETTAGMYVGQVNEAYRGVGAVPRPPQVVAVCDGKRYQSATEVEVIIRTLRRAQRQRTEFQPYVEYARLPGGTHARRYAARAYDFTRASDVAAFIIENADDRHRVYLDLTGSATDRALAAAGPGRVAY